MVRYKNRYIVVEVDNGKSVRQPLKLNTKDLYNTLIETVEYMHGDFGSSAVRPGLYVKYFNDQTRIVIIKVRHGPHKLITSILPFVKKIKEKNIILKILYIGATIHHCYKEILKHQNKLLHKLLQNVKSESEKQKLRSKMLNLEQLTEAYEGPAKLRNTEN